MSAGICEVCQEERKEKILLTAADDKEGLVVGGLTNR